MTREEVVQRYGPIDFASRYWPNKKGFLIMLAIPENWFPNWRVFDPITGTKVRHIACNTDIRKPLLEALTYVYNEGYGDLLKTFDGCFEIRKSRGSNSFSAHSYALAVDLNAFENPLGATHGGFYQQRELVDCFTRVGFTWGGEYQSRPDPMHFSWPGF